MKNRGVSIKLMCLVAISVVAFVGLGLYGISNTASTFTWVDQVYGTAEDFRSSSQQITNPLNELRQLSLSIVMAPNPKLRDELDEKQQALTRQLDRTIDEWHVAGSEAHEAEAFRRLRESWDRYKQIKDVTVDKARERYREEAFINATGAEQQQFEEVNARLTAWMQAKIANADKVYEGATAQERRVFWVSAVVIVLMTLLVGSIGFVTARSIVRPIQVLKAAATRIANRESITTIDVHSKDELGDLARDMESMAAAIQAYIAQQHSAEAEVRKLNTQLEQRVEERTAELQAATETLRREAEDRRREEERYRSLVEATTAIVWNTPASGEFESEQPGWSAFTGQDFEQLQGWGWLNAVHPDDRPHTAAVWSAAVASRSLYEVEHRLRRQDGVYRYMLVRAVPILDGGGDIREWVGIHTDIDDRKRAEVVLRQAKEAAEGANKAKSEFLANMSHEIRTPMNGIIGMTDLALDTDLTSEQREYLEMVKSSADYLLAVINDILDFSKIEAGKLDLDPIDFNLRDHLDDTVTALALRAHTKGLELACHVLADVPDALVGDPGRLRQIIVNLIGNAVKFTGEGEVVMRIERESQTDEDVCLHFCVKDTGIGIPSEKLGVLFQAFSQVDTSTTRKYGGTGLGLAISSQLVKMMGGRVWVESTEGQGSQFHFTARFGLSKSPAPRQVPVELAKAKHLPILVVDDNATNRRILQELLTNWGMKPTVVEGGHRALAAMRQAHQDGEPFSIILMDNMMPDMDGFMLAEEIHRNPELVGSTLMMLSSVDRRENAERCRQLGVTSYMTKPIKRAELLGAIMAAVDAPSTEKVCVATGTRRGIGPSDRGLHLLLTEDNAVNQKLAVRLLEKRGHSVMVATNGKEALEALKHHDFDVVLMDVQMPEMDGFEATRVIRADEQQTGEHIPIVAMTAHAMKGDRERCLELGMDGYISKPLQPSELFEAVESLARRRVAVRESVEDPPPAEPGMPDLSPSIFDREAALTTVGGDAQLMHEIIDLFVAECPKLMTQIREAIDNRDSKTLCRAAHTLKGAASSLGAAGTTAAAQKLETMGMEDDLSGAEDAYVVLDQALTHLQPQLLAFSQEQTG